MDIVSTLSLTPDNIVGSTERLKADVTIHERLSGRHIGSSWCLGLSLSLSCSKAKLMRNWGVDPFDASHSRLSLSVLNVVDANFWDSWSWLMWLNFPVISLFPE